MLKVFVHDSSFFQQIAECQMQGSPHIIKWTQLFSSKQGRGVEYWISRAVEMSQSIDQEESAPLETHRLLVLTLEGHLYSFDLSILTLKLERFNL